MKRALSAFLSLAMAATAFAGCSAASSSVPSSVASTPASSSVAQAEEVTITVSTWDTATNPADSQAIAAFEAAHPNIHVEVVDIPSADYTAKLSVMLNGGSDLDAFWVKDADTTLELSEKGQLVNLNDLIKRDGVDLAAYNGLAETFNFEGNQYAMPVRTDYYVMFYNKDVFDAAGVEYPSNDWTWDDFEEIAGKITTGEGANKTYGAFLHTWNACVQNWGVQDGKHSIMDYQTGYDFFKPAYEMAVRMQDAGTLQDYGELKAGGIHYSGPFPQGTVGMLPMGTWFMSTMAEKVKTGESSVNWGVATLPHPADVEAGYTVGATTPIAINAASEKQEAAWEFVKFVTGEEGAVEYAKCGMIPAMSNDASLDIIASGEGMPEGLKEALQVTNISPDRPIMNKVGEINQMLGEEHSLIMLGEISVDDGLAEMAERAEEILG